VDVFDSEMPAECDQCGVESGDDDDTVVKPDGSGGMLCVYCFNQWDE